MNKSVLILFGVILVLFLIIVNIDDDSLNERSETSGNITKVSMANETNTINETTTINREETMPNQRESRVYLGEDINVSSSWGNPVRLEVNSKFWEDGAYISQDGKTLYFVFYPGDLATDFANYTRTGDGAVFKDDIDAYVSVKPFKTKELMSISKDIYSEGGVMFSGKDLYFMSNRPLNDSDVTYDDNIYKNDYELVLGTDVDEQDPHYCAKLDELYFEIDSQIYVYRTGKKYVKLGEPINLGGEDYQPFLTEDCQTMYFSSNRGKGGKLAIYKSKRLNGDHWSEPEKLVWNIEGVGEPTLTGDGSQLFFVAVNKFEDGSFNSDIFYVDRVE